MPHLEMLRYNTRDGLKVLSFDGAPGSTRNLRTTIITGRNGSYKSTALSQLVSALILPERYAGLTLTDSGAGAQQIDRVICSSGSLADRFPLTRVAGKATEFDSPKYVYLGQRVASNLLSKKQPLETVLIHALDYHARPRFEWNFYRLAFDLVGLQPKLNLRFEARSRDSSRDTLRIVQAIANGDVLDRHGLRISKAMAEWLVTEFKYDVFRELDHRLKYKSEKWLLDLLPSGSVSKGKGSIQIFRLGLLTDQLVIRDALVFPKDFTKSFPIFELSSGEYHILTTILGLGFSIRANSVVLMDEPENSLHPQWQQSLMQIVFELADMMPRNHVVVSTHSPLIVATAPEGSAIVDLERAHDPSATGLVLFGSSADRILLEQFDVASSRNPYVVDIVRRAVALVEAKRTDGVEFQSMRPNLRELSMKLDSNDPLRGIVIALIGDGER